MRISMRSVLTAALTAGLIGGATAQSAEYPQLDANTKARIEADDAAFDAKLAEETARGKGDEQAAEKALHKSKGSQRAARLAASKAAEKGDERRAERLLMEAEAADRLASKKEAQAELAEVNLDARRSEDGSARQIARAEKKAKKTRIKAALARAEAGRVRLSAHLAVEKANLKIDETASALAASEAFRDKEQADSLQAKAELRLDEVAADIAVKKGAAYRGIARWSAASQALAKRTIDQYDPPGKITRNTLIWDNNGPWRKTVVYRDNTLRQSINYVVPQEKVEQLNGMDIGLQVDHESKELSATSGSEETNLLAVNLAHDVISNEKTPEEARGFYFSTIALAKAGKSSPYMERLLF